MHCVLEAYNKAIPSALAIYLSKVADISTVTMKLKESFTGPIPGLLIDTKMFAEDHTVIIVNFCVLDIVDEG